MKQREHKIKCQRHIKMAACEVRARPRAEKNEHRQPGQRLNNHKSGLEQRQHEQAKIDKKHVAEQKRWSVRDGLEGEQVKRREHCDRGKPKGRGKKLTTHCSPALSPCCRCNKQRVKSGNDSHNNKPP